MTPMSRGGACLSCVRAIVVAVVASAAIACAPPPAILGAPVAVAVPRSAMAIADASVDFRCVDGRPPRCDVRARWVLDAPPGGEDVTIVIHHDRLDAVRVWLDDLEVVGWIGAPPDARPASDDEARALAGRGETSAVRVVAAPRARHVITLDGVVRAAAQQPFLDIPPIEARHPWVASEAVDRWRVGLVAFAPRVDGWAGTPRVAVHVARPRAWSEERSETRSRYELHLAHDEPRWTGGPFVGWVTTFAGPMRARAGYDLGYGRALLLRGAFETDFDHRSMLVPTASVTTSIFLFASVAAGVGMPYQLLPVKRAGGRGELSLFLGPLGASIAVDVWPSTNDTEGLFLLDMGF